MNLIPFLNRIIAYSFYVLFLLVPLIFTSITSELFELPKIFLTYFLTLIISSSWVAKMILSRQFRIQRTLLDIPIIIFLISQIISTIISLDPHISLWGYYSRFNGGLISTLNYLILYYAFVSNLNKEHVINILKISLFSGLAVVIWGIPSHFGYDPTCFIFRRSFDTSCWTEAFKPTIRIFSTLGQPAWLAAYISILIPIIFAFAMINSNIKIRNSKQIQNKNNQNSKSFKDIDIENSRLFQLPVFGFRFYYISALLLYAALVYTDTRGGFLGFWIANIIFWLVIYLKKTLTNNQYKKYFLLFNLTFVIFNFLQGLPISQLKLFTLSEIVKNAEPISTRQTNKLSTSPQIALGGTDSGKIRLYVWEGAIEAWKKNPVIGTGVETFAFAYYANKPLGHNLTSEWDYLYNKAHNEYLNYLATTGILGLGSYLAIIGVFLFQSIKYLNSNIESRYSKQNQNTNYKNSKNFENLNLENSDLFHISNFKFHILIIALLSAYISILISNFFGFSVVIINLYFFLIPAFVFTLNNSLHPQKILALPKSKPKISKIPSSKQWYFIIVLFIVIGYLFIITTNYLRADLAYANGQTLNQAGEYREAYPFLIKAVSLVPNEPIYRNELSINMGTIAAALYLQNDVSSAVRLKDQAISLNDNVINTHPNNIVFWKSRVRLFYALAQGDPKNENRYFNEAYKAIKKSQELAPTDAKIAYNLGVLLSQQDQMSQAITELEKAIKFKPDYRDAYFAQGLYYDELGQHQKAISTMQYILTNIDPNDTQAKETLEGWK